MIELYLFSILTAVLLAPHLSKSWAIAWIMIFIFFKFFVFAIFTKV
jgi:hypothetical protein